MSAVSTLTSLRHDPDQVRETARRILQDAAFREAAPSPVQRGIERVLEMVGDLIGRALTTVGASTVTAWVIVALSVLLLLAAFWRWSRGVRLDGAVAEEPADTAGRTSGEWTRSSRAAEQAGDLDVALRHRYLAIVAELEERGVIEPVPGRTIRELDAALAEQGSPLAAPVADVGVRVDRVAYAGSRARPEDVVAARDAHAVIQSPARTPA